MIIIKTIKKHWPALLLAFIIGTIIILPTIISIEKIGLDNFKGIYPMFNGDEDFYLTQTREVYDGHFNLTNAFIKEYKSGPYLHPSLPEIFFSTLAKVFNISVPTLAVFNDFFLPAISVLLLYVLFWKITESKKLSLIFSSLFFLCFIYTFNRPINPQFGFIFLLAGFNLIWLLAAEKYKNNKILIYNISLSIIFGILVYTYPFYWMTLGVVYTIWTFLIAVAEKDFRYWMKNWLSFFIPAVIWSIPFVLNALKLSANPLFVAANLRFGFINTHIPGAFFNVFLMFLCIPIIYLLQRFTQYKKIIFFGWALILGGIILNWQNIITGKILQFSPHFYPIMVLFVFLIGAVVISKINRGNFAIFPKSFVVLSGAVLIIFSLVVYRQKGEILSLPEMIFSTDISVIQNMSPALNWLQDNTPADSAIYALGKNYNWAIPVYTHDNIYFTSNAGLSMISDDELENRWVIWKFFEDIKRDDVYGSREIWNNKFIDTYQSKESKRKILQFITGKKYPETVLMEQKYLDIVMDKRVKFKKEGFEKALKTYEVDYVLVDFNDERYKNLENKFKQYKFLTLMVKLGDVSIFEVE
jgi:hypothetical protein